MDYPSDSEIDDMVQSMFGNLQNESRNFRNHQHRKDFSGGFRVGFQFCRDYIKGVNRENGDGPTAKNLTNYRMTRQVWLLYPEGDREKAYVVPKTRHLAETIVEIGERKDHRKGTIFIIEAGTMKKEDLEALKEFEGF